MEEALPSLSYEANIILMPDKDRKETYGPILLMNTDTKVHNKILASKNQQYIKRIFHGDQGGFIAGVWGWFSISRFISGTTSMDKRRKNHTIISISTERVFDEIQHPFRKTGIQGNFLLTC